MRKAEVQAKVAGHFGTWRGANNVAYPMFLVTTHSRGTTWNMVMNPEYVQANYSFSRERMNAQLAKRWLVTVLENGRVEATEYKPPVKKARRPKNPKLEGYKAETTEFAAVKVGRKVHVHKVGCECQSAKDLADDLIVEEFDSPQELVKSWLTEEGSAYVDENLPNNASFVETRMQLEPCLA